MPAAFGWFDGAEYVGISWGFFRLAGMKSAGVALIATLDA